MKWHTVILVMPWFAVTSLMRGLEGWATYGIRLAGDTLGEDALHLQMYEESLHYRNEADNRYLRPIMTRQFNSSFQMYDGHLYPGAAWRVHMLRHMLGEGDFGPRSTSI